LGQDRDTGQERGAHAQLLQGGPAGYGVVHVRRLE
jgi:hypothetical protein